MKKGAGKPCESRGAADRPTGSTAPKGRKFLAASLTCLKRNNVIGNDLSDAQKTPSSAVPETYLVDGLQRLKDSSWLKQKAPSKIPSKLNVFSAYHLKQAFTLEQNVFKFVQTYGLSNVGFLTLTFPDNVVDNKEAQKRYRSLETNFLCKLFGERLTVKERQKRGAWHYHILLDCKTDIRTGFDFDAIERRDYKSASKDLRVFWSKLRVGLKKYGFGIHELHPIKSNDAAIAKYVGKYLSKHVGVRDERDKNVRLFSCSAGFGKSVTKMAWNNEGSKVWRMKLARLADILGLTEDEMPVKFGPKWNYDLKGLIWDIYQYSPLEVPSLAFLFTQHYQIAHLKEFGHVAYSCLPGQLRSPGLKIVDGTLYKTKRNFIETGEMEELF